MTTKKLGYCCKTIDFPHQIEGINAKDDCKKYNTSGTTITWLNRQTRQVAEEKLWELLSANTAAALAMVERVGQGPAELKMCRLSSDLLPAYTHANWSYFWKQSDVINKVEKLFAPIGQLARKHDVRLSFHPGQFCVLASANPGIVERSIDEFEYHADMARAMGYGKQFQGLKINVHISGQGGPAGIKAALKRLSPEARNCITIENDEITWGIESSLELGNDLALVLDLHHHWVKTGEYIEASDSRIKRVIDSWRGVRPVIHFSTSREDLLTEHPHDQRPSLDALIAAGFKKQKIRAHSDYCWNTAVNTWALTHTEWADILVECKSKNLGVQQLYKFWKNETKSSCNQELIPA